MKKYNPYSRLIILATMNLLTFKSIIAQKPLDIEWSVAASLPSEENKAHPGVAGTFAGWIDQYLLVAGGANFPGKMPWEGGRKVYHRQSYLFKKRADKWTCVNTFLMNSPKAYGASVNVPEGLVCIGGENQDGISDEVFMLKMDRLSGGIKEEILPSLPLSLANHAAVVFDHCIYVAGGETNGRVSDKLYLLRLDSIREGWKETGILPMPLSHAVMLVHNNNIYLIGGRERKTTGISELHSEAWQYNPAACKWTAIARLPYNLSAGTGISYKGKILLFGGDNGEVFHKTEMLIAAIAKETDPVKREGLNAEKKQLQLSHPGFSNRILMYDGQKNKWQEAGSIPFAVPVTTKALLQKNNVWIISGETRAGVRTPDILEGKIINNNH